MRFLAFILSLAFVTLQASFSVAEGIYMNCESLKEDTDICEWKGEPGRALISYKGQERFEAYFYNDGAFSVVHIINKDTRYSIDVSPAGHVGRNLKVGDYYPQGQDHNNFFPNLRINFVGMPKWKRKLAQKILQDLGLYNAAVDGLWGRNTFNAILGYNAIFEQSFAIGTGYTSSLLNNIISHKTFKFLNGKWSATPGAGQYRSCPFNQKLQLETCFSANVCNWATEGSPRRWNNSTYLSRRWVKEAKRRGLTCSVFATTDQNHRPKYQCQYISSDKSSCSDIDVCRHATLSSSRKWNNSGRHGKAWYAEAIRRNLNCGVSHAIGTAEVAKSCSDDPSKCGAVELCEKATSKNDGIVIWKQDRYGKTYADAAKSIGLTCNVASENPEKTYRVANGTGFYISDDGHVVTNQHVIDGCNETQVHSNGQMAAATIVAQDKINDLALLKTELKTNSVFSLASENPYLLQDIIAAGFPFGESISSTIKVTKGVVSSLSGLGDNSGQIQIDAALQPGNSGGPIIDENGNVVGVAVAKLDLEKSIESFGVVPENVNFGIKLSSLKTFLEDNNVNYVTGFQRPIKNSALGKLASEATVLLSCWMTEARIETMQNQKAMFKEILK